jgi:phenylalanyl-tRNA synthetase beta chain
MKVTYSWLKDFVSIKLPPDELAEKLTLAGLEVVSLKEHEGDFIFEIEVTSNRPDWLSISGVAREVGAITGSSFNLSRRRGQKLRVKNRRPVEISISDRKDCPFYSAAIICGVEVAPSPGWLRKRLESLGCRSINNVVDVTNYILFELGQPLHAFDLDALQQQGVIVRRGKTGEKIVTIDGQEIALDQDILVIADKRRPVAIAGVMGGKDTEVTLKTSNILLESAVFDPILVRRSRQKLGLQSESAYRFERGVDLETARFASWAAQELIHKLAGGESVAYKGLGINKTSSRTVKLDLQYLFNVLGVKIPAFRAKQILSSLGFAVKSGAKNILSVKVPSFRQDVKSQVDLVEEIARIYGYDKIPTTLPAVKPRRDIEGDRDAVSGMKSVLQGLGLHEAITYSLVDRELLAKFGIVQDGGAVEILNPLSKEQGVLRSTLLPSLVKAVVYNLNQQQEYVAIFEIADTFSFKPGHPEEKPFLGIALCGSRPLLVKDGLIKDEMDILHMKGILESLFDKFGIKSYDFKVGENNRVNVFIAGGDAGFMMLPDEETLGKFDIKNRRVVLAEIALEKLLENINPEKKFSVIPKYPAVTRDISFLVGGETPVEKILEEIKSQPYALLSSAKVVDYYRGKQIPAGFKGLTISCVYRSDDRTLTEEEVAPLHGSICSLLKERFGARLR